MQFAWGVNIAAQALLVAQLRHLDRPWLLAMFGWGVARSMVLWPAAGTSAYWWLWTLTEFPTMCLTFMAVRREVAGNVAEIPQIGAIAGASVWLALLLAPLDSWPVARHSCVLLRQATSFVALGALLAPLPLKGATNVWLATYFAVHSIRLLLEHAFSGKFTHQFNTMQMWASTTLFCVVSFKLQKKGGNFGSIV